jgi:hypothetical protein
MIVPQDEQARFKYLKWLDLYKIEKPFQLFLDIPEDSPDQRRSNLVYEDGPAETVRDVRGHEADFSVDRNGFAYIKHDFTLSNEEFQNNSVVESTYLPECEKILRENLEGVDRVHFFDWRVSTRISISRRTHR